MQNSATEVLVFLESGLKFKAKAFGDFTKPRGAELVFSTSMSGVEESLTDPSYCGQILLSTSSHVGNTGINFEDSESKKIWAEALFCRHLSLDPSSWRSKISLKDWILREGRYLVFNLDTRALTEFLRDNGSQRCLVVKEGQEEYSSDQLESWLNEYAPSMNGQFLIPQVSCTDKEKFEFNAKEYWPVDKIFKPQKKLGSIAVWDFGVKDNTLRLLSQLFDEVWKIPYSWIAEDILSEGFDAILLSNGPGDPASATALHTQIQKIIGKIPVFGICMGHQLIAHALGAKTSKMNFGHRGIHHPVVEYDEAGKPIKTWITSQNHGFAVDESSIPSNVQVSFRHANDQSIEGLRSVEKKLSTVQFHPEAAPGPVDSLHLLESFFVKGL